MTESPTPSKFAKWKRALIGGLLSGLIAGVALGLTEVGWRIPFVDPLIGWLSLAFMTPRIFDFFSLGNPKTDLQAIFPLMRFWFIIGAIIAYSTKTNKGAFAIWFLSLVVLTFVSFFFVILSFGR